MRAACELKAGSLRGAGLTLRTAALADRDDLALALVANGLGIAIAPRCLAGSDVVALTVRDLGLKRAIGLKWRPDLAMEAVETLAWVIQQATRRPHLEAEET